MVMRLLYRIVICCLVCSGWIIAGDKKPGVKFQTSDRCLACHNGLTTTSGKDVSIGLDWRASVMANSSRDPYWQASVRRETIDHPESKAALEDECSVCHMPITRYEAKSQARAGKIFTHLPFDSDKKDNAKAEDGVSCSVCHQISTQKLGTRESFNGRFVIETPGSEDSHAEYGPFEIERGHRRIMDTSTGGFLPTQAAHIRDSALCGTCHTLYTEARGAGGKVIGELPEQMPYREWLHSDYATRRSCQECHMPVVNEAVPVTAVLGVSRQGLHQHTFVGGNFLMLNMLSRYRDDLSVAALPNELTAGAERTTQFLQDEAARVKIENIRSVPSGLQFSVRVRNLTGHKLPTAYPSRRAWLHVLVKERDDHVLFESGALNADGSIAGNQNDAYPTRFAPHYEVITDRNQVEIYESILKDEAGRVTTGLISAVGYLKDNRLLPAGFDKQTAEKDIAVIGEAAEDTDFHAGEDLVHYAVDLGGAQGPFRVEVELWYQPIGFRWAHNLGTYDAGEPRRFVSYYDSMSSSTALLLTRDRATF
jgi:hypothetical protein